MILHFHPAACCRFAAVRLVVLAVCILSAPVFAQNVILYLKSGDQVSGIILSESTSQVVVSNAWVKVLPVPLAEISRRESVPAVKPATPVAATAAQPAASPAKVPPPAIAVAAVTPSMAKPSAPKGQWHGQASVGLAAMVGTKSQQDYFGKFKLAYSQAYASNPKKFFRNTSDLTGQYQKTDGQISANRVNGSNKSDFDLGERTYGYGSFGAGYDNVRKINFQYQIGSGVGWHALRSDRFVLDFEGGFDYEVECRRDINDLDSVYLRLAQDLTWAIAKNLKFVEKVELYSDMADTSQYRCDVSSTLSYGFWKNLTFNLTADDKYATEVAPGVENNEFQMRLTLGVTF
jgi:putative salt-induced outer membrane protein YdiY